MASILCSKCNRGIHYHGEPNGIQYIVISKRNWNKIVSSRFDAKKKITDSMSGYPKLYRTDTIEEDFPEFVKKFWKCPYCGTLHFFDSEGMVLSAYEPETPENEIGDSDNMEGWYFDDYKWDELTEKAIPDFKLPKELKSLDEITLSEKKISMKNADKDLVTTYKIF